MWVSSSIPEQRLCFSPSQTVDRIAHMEFTAIVSIVPTIIFPSVSILCMFAVF